MESWFVLHAITFAAAISFIEVKVYVTLNRVLSVINKCALQLILLNTWRNTLLLNDCGAGTEIKGLSTIKCDIHICVCTFELHVCLN